MHRIQNTALPKFAPLANDTSSEPSVRVGLILTANECTRAPPLIEVQRYIMFPMQRYNLQFLHGPAVHASLEHRWTIYPTKHLGNTTTYNVIKVFWLQTARRFIWGFQRSNICRSVGVNWAALICVGLTSAMHLISILVLNYYGRGIP